MGFLYFPDDKTAYIPSLFVLALFTIGAILITRIFINVSRKEAKKVDEQYKSKVEQSLDENKEK